MSEFNNVIHFTWIHLIAEFRLKSELEFEFEFKHFTMYY